MSDSSSHQQQQDSSSNPPRREIGEVVQGLHGGKYQFFGHDAAASPLTYEGRLFAEMGYSSSSGDTTSTRSNDNLENNEPLPNWAGRLVEFPLPADEHGAVRKLCLADVMMDDGCGNNLHSK